MAYAFRGIGKTFFCAGHWIRSFLGGQLPVLGGSGSVGGALSRRRNARAGHAGTPCQYRPQQRLGAGRTVCDYHPRSAAVWNAKNRYP